MPYYTTITVATTITTTTYYYYTIQIAVDVSSIDSGTCGDYEDAEKEGEVGKFVKHDSVYNLVEEVGQLLLNYYYHYHYYYY